MLASQNTEQRIIKAMENGAKLVFYCYRYGSWADGQTLVSRVTLERDGKELELTTRYRTDEYYYVPFDEDGAKWLRHGEESQPLAASFCARRIIRRKDVREAYAGYRSDYATSWREVFEHVNQPVPRWVSEQWDSPAFRFENV